MAIRIAKIIILISIDHNKTLIILNNITDYDINHNYVRHITCNRYHLPQQTLLNGEILMPRSYNMLFCHLRRVVFYVAI
jgi:predicted small integral membrane protein